MSGNRPFSRRARLARSATLARSPSNQVRDAPRALAGVVRAAASGMPVLVPLIIVAVVLSFAPSVRAQTEMLAQPSGGWFGTFAAAFITIGVIAIVLKLAQ